MSRPRTAVRVPPALLPILVAAVLAGCGSDSSGSGSGQDPDRQAGERIGTVETVDCPDSATAVELPSGFSAPLPQGTVVVDVRHGSEDRTVVTGVVPAAEKDVLAGLQQAYPAAGLSLIEGETEEHDAESNFTGKGTKGRWGIRELSQCSPTATRIDVVVAPS